MSRSRYDVAIVGGGAAGLSAALVLGRARRRVAVIDAGSPRNAPAAHMQGFLSRDGMPTELLDVGRAEVTGYGVELFDDRVAHIEPGFVVRAAGGDVLHARRILLATGVRDELPDLPACGSGGDATSCTARIATGGRSATSRSASSGHDPTPSSTPCWCANGRTTWCSSRTRWTSAGTIWPRWVHEGIRVVSGDVAGLVVDDDHLTGVQLASGEVVPRAAKHSSDP